MATAEMTHEKKHLAGLKTFKELVAGDEFKKSVAQAVPKHMTADRFVRIAITAMTRTPALMDCTQASVFECLLRCAQYGLEPDGRQAHLIPYGKTCTLIIDYKGYAELVYRSGLVSRIHADLICENDEFDENLGRIITHRVNRKGERGEPFAAYALVEMKDGTQASVVMSKSEIEDIRKQSRAGNSGPWRTHWGEMAKKTAFRRLVKWLPISSEIRDLSDDDDTPAPITLPASGTRTAAIANLIGGAADEPSDPGTLDRNGAVQHWIERAGNARLVPDVELLRADFDKARSLLTEDQQAEVDQAISDAFERAE